jgi:hypothetical protein
VEEKMTDQKPILKADDLSKRYEDGVLTLDHLNLEVRTESKGLSI